MNDDERMDQLLRDALGPRAASERPRLSPNFETRVLRRVRPRRLTPVGRAVLAFYIAAATATAAWLFKDLPPAAVLWALAITAPVAAGASAYSRRLVRGE